MAGTGAVLAQGIVFLDAVQVHVLNRAAADRVKATRPAHGPRRGQHRDGSVISWRPEAPGRPARSAAGLGADPAVRHVKVKTIIPNGPVLRPRAGSFAEAALTEPAGPGAGGGDG